MNMNWAVGKRAALGIALEYAQLEEMIRGRESQDTALDNGRLSALAKKAEFSAGMDTSDSSFMGQIVLTLA